MRDSRNLEELGKDLAHAASPEKSEATTTPQDPQRKSEAITTIQENPQRKNKAANSQEKTAKPQCQPPLKDATLLRLLRAAEFDVETWPPPGLTAN